MADEILSQEQCDAIYMVCNVTPLANTAPFGFVAGAVLKDPSPENTKGRAIVHQYDPGNGKGVTVFTIDDKAGLYLFTCPRPPCGRGSLS